MGAESRNLTKEEWLARCGNIGQVAGITHTICQDGPAKGMELLQVKNGPLHFTVMPGKGLDISELSYRGVNLSFLAKPGLMGPRGAYDANGAEAVKTIMGGLLFTAGPDNIGPPCEIEGRRYPMHGCFRVAPAQNLCYSSEWQGEEYRLTIKGTLRFAELFGANLLLTRTIQTTLGKPQITLYDSIENQGFTPQPLMMLYHCNAGYPLLDAGAKLLLPSVRPAPRDAPAAEGLAGWDTMGPPVPQKGEQVFLHTPAANGRNETLAALINPGLALGLCLRYRTDQLPRFYQWKSEAAGDYALGLEPANASVLGRAAGQNQPSGLPLLEPMQSQNFQLCFEVLEGPGPLAALEQEKAGLLHKKSYVEECFS